MCRPAIAIAVLLALPSRAQERRDPRVEAIIQRIDAGRMHATVEKLVSFGTRHTLSDAKSETRGIGAARAWLAAQFAALASAEGSRLKPFEDRFVQQPGPRVPAAVELVNVGAVLPGADGKRGKQAIVMTGHYDSRASDPLDGKSDAPGAVDDGSGTAMALELARVMAAESPAVTIYFVAVAGEEQGLLGSQHLAERLKAEGVEVLAMASVDIAGNAEGQDGIKDTATARLFSEGVATAETEKEKKLREALGLDNDSRAREWARYVARVGQRYVDGLKLRVLLRRDRIARGSDHMSFAKTGVPALRLSESRENYRRQHQDVRSEDGVQYGDDLQHFDAAYAARLCRALGAALASLSFAPAAPGKVALGGAVSTDTVLRWKLPDDERLADAVLYLRPAESVQWQTIRSLGKVEEVTLPSVIPDDSFFAVAAADAAGNESLPQPPSQMSAAPQAAPKK
jgi:hypothetical protein